MKELLIDGFTLTAEQVLAVARDPGVRSAWPIPRAAR